MAAIMAEVLCNRAPKRFPSKEDHPTQALFLYGSDESFSVRIQIGRTRRQSNDVNTFAHENSAECLGVFRISADDGLPNLRTSGGAFEEAEAAGTLPPSISVPQAPALSRSLAGRQMASSE
jgi:hypothetical protein